MTTSDETDWGAVDEALRNPPKGPVEYQVVQHGAFLATRHVGQQARNAVEALLAVVGAGERVTLDFIGVEAVTGAFADELVARLIQEHGTRIVVMGANVDVAETVQLALSRRAEAELLVGDDHLLDPEDPP